MSATDLMLIAGTVALFATAPWIIAGPSRRHYIPWDLAGWLAAVVALAAAPAVGAEVDIEFPFAALLGIKLILFSIFCATRRPSDLRWSPGVAAIFTVAVYTLVLTHVQQWPPDGDEPYYVLAAESIRDDFDLDLRNQYESLHRSAVDRTDLGPQIGDPVGPDGEQFSRHEPLLSLLLVPGLTVAGLWGAGATIALLAALAVAATLRLLREAGGSERLAIAFWPLIAFGPPLIFYAVRIWPEAPAALCFAEALRAANGNRRGRMLAWLIPLALLKLRFVPIVAIFVLWFLLRRRPGWKTAVVAVLALALPLLAVWLVSGSVLNVHMPSELMPSPLWKYIRGGFGLLLDAQTGLLFQAPLYFLGVIALVWPERLPFVARLGFAAALPYLVLLMPRDEWHGGWSPPLRYLVVFVPLLALAAASLARRGDLSSRPEQSLPLWLIPVSMVSAAVSLHAVAFPWRIWRIASGESLLGEHLSVFWAADASRMFPSYIRPNLSAWVYASCFVLMVVTLVLMRFRPGSLTLARDPSLAAWSMAAPLALVIAIGFVVGKAPGSVVHFEDAHVVHRGGSLDPEEWTVARFRFTGGWRLGEGEAMSFAFEGGAARLVYRADDRVRIELDGIQFELRPTLGRFDATTVTLPDQALHELRVISGSATFDRIESIDG